FDRNQVTAASLRRCGYDVQRAPLTRPWRTLINAGGIAEVQFDGAFLRTRISKRFDELRSPRTGSTCVNDQVRVERLVGCHHVAPTHVYAGYTRAVPVSRETRHHGSIEDAYAGRTADPLAHGKLEKRATYTDSSQ